MRIYLLEGFITAGTVRMTEWLSQYEKVAQKQQQYLQKIRDLRLRLQSKDERYMMLSIERMRRLPPFDSDSGLCQAQLKASEYKSHVPWSSSLLTHSFCPKMGASYPGHMMVSPGPLISDSRGGSYSCIISGERLVPKMHPAKRLSPINSTRLNKELRTERLSKPEIALERNKTDYEPIEDIAKRNRIQFSRYLASRDGKDERNKNDNSGRDGARDFTRRLSVVANAGDDVAQDV